MVDNSYLKLKIDENLYVLCNVYTPTQDHKHDQINFLIDVKNSLSTYENENDNIEYRKEMLYLLDSMNLSDCFRNLYPNLRRYTCHARGKSSRLDYWFISENLLNDLLSYKIQPGLHSDHSTLIFEIGNNNLSRGKGFWKFNTSLLHDTLYVENIKEIIQNYKLEYNTITNKGLVRELIKMEIRSYTPPYCVKKRFKKSLEKQLVDLQKALDINPDQTNIDRFQTSKKVLNIKKQEMQAHILR